MQRAVNARSVQERSSTVAPARLPGLISWLVGAKGNTSDQQRLGLVIAKKIVRRAVIANRIKAHRPRLVSRLKTKRSWAIWTLSFLARKGLGELDNCCACMSYDKACGAKLSRSTTRPPLTPIPDPRHPMRNLALGVGFKAVSLTLSAH